jgi:Family of unknown function (DUF6335)
MAKRPRAKVSRRAQKRAKSSTKRRKRTVARRARASPSRRSATRRAARKKTARKRAVRRVPVPRLTTPRTPVLDRLNRSRRVLPDEDTLRTPPSSLDMDRHGSAARSGRRGLEANIRRHNDMSPALTGGDVDADWENAYFSGDEAPGGDNPAPDTEVVDDIGRALGVEYQDNEELQGSEKVIERDTHRWELDPASSDDYKDRT